MFEKVLIANRGAIACRIIRSLKRLGIASVAVYSEADAHSLHVRDADQALCIGPAPAAQSYLDGERIIQAARSSGADAIHPGYGFLSENPQFAQACESAGLAFIGPTPAQMRAFGLKHSARELATQAEVPLLPGSGLLQNLAHARREATRVGYPLMLKSTAGGGGIGMQLCHDQAQLEQAFPSVERLARSNFSQGGIFLEKYVHSARHIEVQIFGDGQGGVVALGERDCSLQRRNQKIVEETPAPGIDEALRARVQRQAVALGRAVSYRSAGTVEFVYDRDAGECYFLEVNTRLQVEHGVTEAATDVDLVEWMLRAAAGESGFLADYRHRPRGHAIQVRLYAEDPGKHFQPAAGVVTELRFAEAARIETWIERGSEVSSWYDPMLAKLIVHAPDRDAALQALSDALARTAVHGIETNLAYLRQIVAAPTFAAAAHDTRWLEHFAYRSLGVDVLAAGTQSMIQDYPGRQGYWNIGVPPSGPMDNLAFRLVNRVLGNPPGAAALELTVTGPTLRFKAQSVVALGGARMQARLDGEPVEYWRPLVVPAGGVLELGSIGGGGSRTYLAVKGGFDVPEYMGSRSTFTLGQFGGHGGRPLQVGDVLRLHQAAGLDGDCRALPDALIPHYGDRWEIAVLYGPHGAPDFFTPEDIETFFAIDWEVHYNSSRTGVRLIGPKPQWARSDGGEAGLHPSNLHDNAYAVGSIDFTGDMPVILGPDGPSLGGFVCPATLAQAELWKLGQLRPGDRIRFHRIDIATARQAELAQQRMIATLTPQCATVHPLPLAATAGSPVLHQLAATEHGPAVCYRQAGDRNLLIEYGPPVLDLNLRLRAHALMRWIERQQIAGIVDLTPGIRSLQVHFDSQRLGQAQLLERLLEAEAELPPVEDMVVPSRIVHLPLSWDDPSTRLAIEKYMQSVRADAPWCPSNIEFIRRINGLESIEQVQQIVFNATYLVMGLGDVYLGAPVATPLDPRHRLVTTKYNPARTWTPENAVGIGGAYLCVYGMEGPGGYQFVGRTLQMWNRYRQSADFRDGKQWLLRFFDQIRFFPVTSAELARMREDFTLGRLRLRVEDSELNLRDYHRFLSVNAESIAAFKHRQQAAFDAERERWAQLGLPEDPQTPASQCAPDPGASAPPDGCRWVASPVTGSVWKIAVALGQRVAAGDTLVVVEAMKMEIAVEADAPGRVRQLLCRQGKAVQAGRAIVVLETEASKND